MFAVVEASRDPEKFGHKVYQTLKRYGYTVYPVNPNAEDIDGDEVYPTLDNVPEKIDCIVTVVPPEVTVGVARLAGRLHVPYLWMQPGSESQSAVLEAQEVGVMTIHGGPCIMAEATARRRGLHADEGRAA